MDNFSEDAEQRQKQKEFEAKRQAALGIISEKIIGKKADGTLPGPKRPEVEKDYGKVRVWSLAEKKYIILFPIDAAEAIAIGSACLECPDEVE